MDSQIRTGDVCELKGEVTVGGSTVFVRGELVTVEDVLPDERRPDYCYSVFSTMANRRFKLSDRELKLREKAFAPEYHSAAEPWAAQSGADGAEGGGGLTMTRELEESVLDIVRRRRWILYVALAILLAVAGVVTYRLVTRSSGPEATLKRFFGSAHDNDLAAMLESWDPESLAADPGTKEFLESSFISSHEKGTTGSSSWNVALASGLSYETNVKNDRAVVEVSSRDVSGTVAARLVLKDGKWYIAEMKMGPAPWMI